ncbi:NAD(P)/FAD-dependent oxidoreductase [Kiloniella sp.]|uniref:NAD(P)/FAD-dependent oxidoreductase n=1 Tax=Kiloniella sp. TaxID=1938587 RepID=UPI003A8D8634
MSNPREIKKYDVAVIGGGMVGISSALWLQKSGYSVCVIDRCSPGNSTASGSACTFADYACIPINSPSLPFKVPAMVLSKNSPFAVKWNYIYRMFPWLSQFISHCRPKEVTRIIDALAVLLSKAESGLMPLIEDAGAKDLIQRHGCLYLYNTEKGYRAANSDILARQERGVSLREVEAGEIYELEPSLTNIFYKGVFFDKSFQFLYPGKLIERLTEHFVSQGGAIFLENVKKLESSGDQNVRVQCENAEFLVQKSVVAAGAYSLDLLPSLVGKMPLDTERGYHVMLSAQNTSLSRPVGWAEKGFYMTPLSDQVRIAGTVELGGLQNKYTESLMNYLERTAKTALPDLGERQSEWLGFRPSMPDALPVIGPSPQNRNIILAFGHQHVGLTLGGITGKVVSSIVEGKKPSFDLSSYSPKRFV